MNENVIVNRLRELTEDGEIEWTAEGLSFPGFIDFKTQIGPPLLIVEVRSGGPIAVDEKFDHWLVIHQQADRQDSGTRIPEKAVVIEPSKGTGMLVDEILDKTFSLPSDMKNNDEQQLQKVVDILNERFPL